MRKTWRITALILAIPAILAAAALPVGAASSDSGVPKTNAEHPAWLLLDPVVEKTDAKQVTVSGRVAGNFDMKVTNWDFVRTFEATGWFSVDVDLFGGVNHIWLSGVDRAGRLINQEIVVVCTAVPDRVALSVDKPLVANHVSTATLTATVLDVTGGVARGYTGAVTFTSSDPSVVQVVSAASAAANGVATATLKASAAVAPVTITVTAEGLADATIQVTPAPQVPATLTLRADPVKLATEGTGTLYLSLKDQEGVGMLSLHAPVRAKLITNNPSAVYFGTGQSELDLSIAAPTSQVAFYGGVAVSTATLSGTATNPDGSALTVNSVQVATVIVGVPYQIAVDPLPTVSAGTQQVAFIRLLDWTGIQVSDSTAYADLTVSRTNPDGSVQTLGVVHIANGVGQFPFVTDTPGTYTLTVSGVWWGYPMLPGSQVYNVTP